MLLTDRLWPKRLNGEGEHPNQLDAILYEDRAELTRARLAFDAVDGSSTGTGGSGGRRSKFRGKEFPNPENRFGRRPDAAH